MLQPATPHRRTDNEIQSLRAAGRIAAVALKAGVSVCRAGVTTAEINGAVARKITQCGGEALFKGYRQGRSPPFPGACCVSVNEEVVHGIPGPRLIRPGDAVSIDVGVRLDGWCGDTATTVLVTSDSAGFRGEPGFFAPAPGTPDAARLIRVTRDVLAGCIAAIRPGVRWSEIAVVAERHAEKEQLGIVTEYVGHGLGRTLHEPPKVPCFATGFVGDDFVLEPGMVLAIEPLLTLDGPAAWLPASEKPGPTARSAVCVARDGWTVRTVSGAWACHEEHSVLVTGRGADILTA